MISRLARLDLDIEALARQIDECTETLAAARCLRERLAAPPPPKPAPKRPGPKPGTGRKPIRHGTNAGYMAHLRHDVPMCDRCAEAHACAKRAGRPASSASKGRKTAAAPVTCPGCGFEFRASGYPAHRRRCADAPRQPLPPASAPTVPGHQFVCSCGHRADRVDQMIRHTVEMHQRPPFRVERRPQPSRPSPASAGEPAA